VNVASHGRLTENSAISKRWRVELLYMLCALKPPREVVKGWATPPLKYEGILIHTQQNYCRGAMAIFRHDWHQNRGDSYREHQLKAIRSR
jgi:hypothetical protein